MANIPLQQPDFGTGSKELNIYVAGFVACIVLTLFPFLAVIFKDSVGAMTVGIIVASAIAQLIIQLVCFLRLNYHTEQAKLNVRSMALVLFTLFVIIVGSLWIMATLNYRMMH